MAADILNKHLRLSLFLLYLSVSASGIHPVTLRQISIDQGLPGVSLQCIYQDSKGLMWFGVESVGLCKFDGQDFTSYENLPEDSTSISNNFPIRIIEDKTGIIWVGTLNGLNKFDRKTGTFERYFHDPADSNSITDNLITDLHIDNYGYLWIATSGGLSKYNINKDEFVHVSIPGDVSSAKINVSDIHEDYEGNIWIGTLQSGMFLIPANINYLHSQEWYLKFAVEVDTKLSAETITIDNSTKENILINNEIRQICNTYDGRLWIGTSQGLFLYNIIQNKLSLWKFEDDVAEVLNEADYNILYIDSKGILWSGTASDGLVTIDLKQDRFTHLDANMHQMDGLKSNSIRAICEDKSGLVWIGTKFEGIQIYDRRQEVFDHIQENSEYFKGLSNKFVLSVLEDSEGIIWIGTKEGGLNRYNPVNNSFNYYRNVPLNSNSIRSNRIEYILEDANKNIWLATPEGLEKLDRRKQLFEHYGNLNIICLAEDMHGRIWIGSISSGIYLLDPDIGNIERYPSKNQQLFGNNSYRITRIFTDSKNDLWVGTSQNGLFKHYQANDSLVHYMHNPDIAGSISGNMIRSIYEDKKGNIWVGTKTDGLNRLDPETGIFQRIKKSEGLGSNTIYSILEDNSGNLWMGTHDGIIKYNPLEKIFVSFNESYGLQGKVFEINASEKGADGMMYFGGNNGLNIFNPDSTYKRDYLAPVIVSSVQIFDRIVAVDITEYHKIILESEDKYISFNYSMLDYSDPISRRYRYMLENFDNEWIYARNRHYATYTSLPPGEYVFKVQGSSPDGYWNENSILINLVVPTPYWMEWWFSASLIILVIALIIAVYRLRVGFVRRNEKRLLKIVKQKTADLSEANERLEIQKAEIEKHNQELIQQRNKISLQNKELEQHRLHLEKLVSERTKDLEEAKRKAEESDRLKSAFLANMSHEIRTPLNAIVGFTDLITNEDYEKDELKDINNIIKTNSSALLQLINDIIDISKIEANQIEINYREFFINEFLHGLFQTYEAQMLNFRHLGENGIKLKLYLDITNEDMRIVSDPFRIEQIFNNLFSNAQKFTRKGTIEMGYRIIQNKKFIRFYMKDTGIGITRENMDVIFDRFRKIEDDKTKIYRGTGLGLSISSNLTKLLGGKLVVESEYGKGSMFYFDLPLKIAGLKVKPKEKTLKSQKDIPDWRDKTVLIVEDEDSNFKVLKTMLSKTGLKVLRAEDGKSAISMFKDGNHAFDLVLMDIKLPEMNGIEATKIIKEHNSNIPVIAQTAYAMFNEEKEIMKAGFDDYLTKPILSSVLIEKLTGYLND